MQTAINLHTGQVHLDGHDLPIFVVPDYGQGPSDEMVAFLHECPHDWDGDESGINMHDRVASPGDFVARKPDNNYTVVPSHEIEEFVRCADTT